MTLAEDGAREPAGLAAQSSMLNWWPRVEGLPIPQPETHCVKVDQTAMERVAYGEAPLPEGVVEGVQIHCSVVGYPAFIRTDHMSGKHSWKKTCYLERREDVPWHMARLAEESLMAGLTGGVSFGAVFVRKFLNLKTSFTAFHGQMPINREVRCFIRDGSLECQHGYWFEGVFEEEEKRHRELAERIDMMNAAGAASSFQKRQTGLPADWRSLLRELNTLKRADHTLLKKYAETVGEAFPDGYWTVDFAQGDDGTWYLIDMARGELSYHLTTCGYAPEELP